MKISVVIPCFNGEIFLAPTIRSVLNQTLPPAEIIVVDNGSADGSVAVAERFGERVTVMSEPLRGASAARNAGAEAATGDALMFLDADDLLGPDALQALAAGLAARPDQVACCPWDRLELVNGCWLAKPASCAPRRRGQDDLAAWLSGWYHPPCAVLWSRAAYGRAGGWDPDVGVNDDGDVMMRGFIAGNVLVRTAAGVAYYRRLPPGQTSLSGTQHTRRGLESQLRVLNRLAAMLQERGRLRAYRQPLSRAFRGLAQRCGDQHPDLRERCVGALTRPRG